MRLCLLQVVVRDRRESDIHPRAELGRPLLQGRDGGGGSRHFGRDSRGEFKMSIFVLAIVVR